MNTEDRLAAERRVAAWLENSAPTPPAGLASRLLGTTATLPQRGRGFTDMFAIRMGGAAVVVATAAVVGLGLSQVIGPQEPTGTPPPISATPSVEPTTSPSPSPMSDAPSPSPSPVAQGPGRIAFQANRDNDTSGIYVMDEDGSNVAQVVDDPAFHELDPIWAPDGSLISYITMSADGTMQGGVFVVDPEGGEPVLVDDNYAYGPATWSPDGSMLAVAGDGSERGIAVYHVSEGRLEVLTEDGGTAPHWSPDGSRIAYDVAPPNDIRIVEVATGETRNVTDDAWNDSVARWSADGERLVFVSDRDTDQSRDSQRTWVVDADGGEPELLGDEPVLAFAHWPSPDGEWLAYAAPGGGLRLSRADGSEDRQVHPDTPADRGASWAADSSGFVFSNAGEAPRELFLMRVDAEAPQRLTEDPADDSAPNWGPPGS
jgi:Tol biopolymer transport system component